MIHRGESSSTDRARSHYHPFVLAFLFTYTNSADNVHSSFKQIITVVTGSYSQLCRLRRTSECAKHDCLASVIAQLFLGLLQLEKDVRGADEDPCDMLVGTLKPIPLRLPTLTFKLDHIAHGKLDITGVQQRDTGRLLFSPLHLELDPHVLASGIDP